FKVGLTAYLNDCWDSICHTIKVSAREASATKSARFSAFGQIRVWPNPNNGHFSVDMTMNGKSTVVVKLADLATGVIIDERQVRGSDRYILNYSLNLMPGTYLLYFQCGNEAKTKKIIVI
ncbi:MAG: T9SS type A sorting domain-containing protein, partial [Bacteroidota bacterium]|nr:T9SS type A sorting domain-containing protein [Bacteroidota bacterium]